MKNLLQKAVRLCVVLIAISLGSHAQIYTPSGAITGTTNNGSSVSIGDNSSEQCYGPLEVTASYKDASGNTDFFTTDGWNRNIILRPNEDFNTSTLIWEKGGCEECNDFFIGGPSINPSGIYTVGLAPGLCSDAIPDYITHYYSVEQGSRPLAISKGTTRFLHNLLVDDLPDDNDYNNHARFAVGTLYPRQAAHIHDGNLLISGSDKFGSILFSDQTSASVETYYGNWGIKYLKAGALGGSDPGGLNFWTPNLSNAGFANNRLYLSDVAGRVGINNANPHNRLEITSELNDAKPSGLRFTNLTSSSSLETANGRVLTVNANGDVILVPGGGNGILNSCTATGIIPKVDGTGTGNLICSQVFDNGTSVGVGTTSINSAIRLDVAGNVSVAYNSGYYGKEAGSVNHRILAVYNGVGGINTVAVGADAGNSNVSDRCVYAGFESGKFTSNAIECTFLGSQTGHSFITGSSATYVGTGSGYSDQGSLGNTAVGDYSGYNLHGTYTSQPLVDHPGNGNSLFGYYAGGFMEDGTGNTFMGEEAGVNNHHGNYNSALGMRSGPLPGSPVYYTTAIGANANPAASNFIMLGAAGTVGATATGQCNVGIGYDSPHMNIASGNAYRLSVNGDAWSLTGVWTGSDLRYKKNIEKISGAVEKIKKLDGVTYNWRQDEFKNLSFTDQRSAGVIAQQLKEILPEAVNEDEKGFYAVNYAAITPLLIEAIKEQQKQVEELQQTVQGLEKGLSECCSNYSLERTPSNSVEKNEGARLEQNAPNPFSDKTIIRFYIPSSASKSFIKIYSIDGTEKQSFSIPQKGIGQVEISGNTFSPGTYVYHLIIDGKNIDSKLMTVTR